ncbi:MAG: 5'-methylthioadenosine/adenosylhomocysteine nucleosidase [Spirochaetaceae bacterium]|jgi:adenosylhomocysteine nucleosidase|nr:5'-methylthioadenosine/adenosylhomocysteine nucleosidase [Spirochaetaceae bacterium]
MTGGVIGVIGAMEEEVDILFSRLKDAKKENHGGFEYLSGVLGGKNAVILKCGIGKVNASVGCALLLDHYKPDLVINTGCAGGVNSGGGEIQLDFGDAVFSERLVYHDVDLTAFGYAPGQLPGFKQYFFTPPHLLEKAENAVEELKRDAILPENFNAVRGVIASADVFVCDSSVVRETAAKFPGLRAVEMEGAAIAHTCLIFNTPCLVIRCLSDIAGEKSPVTFDEYLHTASKHSSEIVIRLLENGL